MPARDFYTADGIKNTVLEPGEIVVRAIVPLVSGRRSAFEKLRKRGAIDFPLLSVAARVDFPTRRRARSRPRPTWWCPRSARGRGASARRPRWGRGRRRTGSPETLAQAAFAECKPLTNLDDDAAWRREMVPVVVEKAVRRALGPPGLRRFRPLMERPSSPPPRPPPLPKSCAPRRMPPR